MSKKITVFLRTFGCQMNVRDSEVICGLLRATSYELTTKPEEADIIIFNTCSVRQHAEDKVWSEVGRVAKLAMKDEGRRMKEEGRKRPIIGLVGCMAQNYKEQIFQRAQAVDFVVGPSDIDKIPEIIERVTKSQSHKVTGGNLFESKIWETDSHVRPEEIYHTGFYEDKNHVYVVISEGCSNYCSYCVVPYVRGPIHHRQPQDIIKEIEKAVASGIQKITLLGQNVNAYKSQGQCEAKRSLPRGGNVTRSQVGFIELLCLVNAVKELKEFSFITSHPKDVLEGLFKAMAKLNKLKKYLHLPVQSGSNRILKAMNRGYSREYYLQLIEEYRKIVKQGVLTTDIIVGFPGETERDFQDTFDLVKEAQFDAGFIFKYSGRPHTEAEKLTDDVAKEEKERRHSLILQLQKKISRSKRC